MKRRTFLSTIGAVGLAGCGSTETTSTTRTNSTRSRTQIPEGVTRTKELGIAFHKRLSPVYPEARVYITLEPEVVFEFSPESSTGDGLRTEFRQIAVEFGDIVRNGEEYEPTTLSMVTGSVEGIAPESSVMAYAAGRLDKEAFAETIEVMELER